MEQKLTDRQRAILEFIEEAIDGEGYPPTVREICKRFRISSPRGVSDHLGALGRKGFIGREAGRARGIRLVHKLSGMPIVGRVAAGDPIMAIENVEDQLIWRIFSAGRTCSRWRWTATA